MAAQVPDCMAYSAKYTTNSGTIKGHSATVALSLSRAVMLLAASDRSSSSTGGGVVGLVLDADLLVDE